MGDRPWGMRDERYEYERSERGDERCKMGDWRLEIRDGRSKTRDEGRDMGENDER